MTGKGLESSKITYEDIYKIHTIVNFHDEQRTVRRV